MATQARQEKSTEIVAGKSFEPDMPSVDLQKGEMIDDSNNKLDEAELFIHENNSSWEQVEALLSDKTKYRALVRKVDLQLLPLLMVTYGLQLIDKTTLSYSAVFDLREATNLVRDQYAWTSSIFYFGTGNMTLL